MAISDPFAKLFGDSWFYRTFLFILFLPSSDAYYFFKFKSMWVPLLMKVKILNSFQPKDGKIMDISVYIHVRHCSKYLWHTALLECTVGVKLYSAAVKINILIICISKYVFKETCHKRRCQSAASSDTHWCCGLDKTPTKWEFLLRDTNCSQLHTNPVLKRQPGSLQDVSKVTLWLNQRLSWNGATFLHTWNGVYVTQTESCWAALGSTPLWRGLWAKSNPLGLTKDGAAEFEQHLKRQSSTFRRQKRQSNN